MSSDYEIEKEFEELLEENKQLKELCNKYEEEHKTTFETWINQKKILIELELWLSQEQLDRADNIGIYALYEKVIRKVSELKEKYK